MSLQRHLSFLFWPTTVLPVCMILTNTFHDLLNSAASDQGPVLAMGHGIGLSQPFWRCGLQTHSVSSFSRAVLLSPVKVLLWTHRIKGIGGDLWRSSCLTPVLKLVPWSGLHRKACREGLEVVDSLLQCSVALTVKNFFLMFVWNVLGSSLCPLLLFSYWAHCWKQPDLISLTPTLQIFITVMRCPVSLLSFGLERCRYLNLRGMLQALKIFVDLLCSLSRSSLSCLNWKAQNWT